MKILIAGDFYPASQLKPLINSGDYRILQDIIPITRRVDYAIVNFESPVVLGNYKPIKKCGPNLRSSKKAIEAIKYAGFDMVTLANNHILDYGELGIKDTLKTCDDYQIDTIGAGPNLMEASRVFYKQIGDKKLALINCCEHEFSIATNESAGANPLDSIQQFYQIHEARKNADYVLVIVHGGHEHFQLPSPRMVNTYRFFIDAGADVVVNHHQHCYSGYEVYNGKPIFYGLGNFCFDNEKFVNSTWNEGFLLELHLLYGNITFKLHPYSQCNGNLMINFFVDKKVWEFNMEQLNSIIANEEILRKKCNEFYYKRRKMMLSLFEPYYNKVARKLYDMGILPSFFKGKRKQFIKNMIYCESHRDILSYCVNISK